MPQFHEYYDEHRTGDDLTPWRLAHHTSDGHELYVAHHPSGRMRVRVAHKDGTGAYHGFQVDHDGAAGSRIREGDQRHKVHDPSINLVEMAKLFTDGQLYWGRLLDQLAKEYPQTEPHVAVHTRARLS